MHTYDLAKTVGGLELRNARFFAEQIKNGTLAAPKTLEFSDWDLLIKKLRKIWKNTRFNITQAQLIRSYIPYDFQYLSTHCSCNKVPLLHILPDNHCKQWCENMEHICILPIFCHMSQQTNNFEGYIWNLKRNHLLEIL